MQKRARNKSRWGGARAGAGRPPSGARPSERHETRALVVASHPVHVTAHVSPRIAALLRDTTAARARELIARAIELSHARENFRIVHLAIHEARLELVVEATDKRALARGMQGFQVAAARSLNRAARRAGNVFPDRYHARSLGSRHALARVVARLPRGARTRLGAPESPLFA